MKPLNDEEAYEVLLTLIGVFTFVGITLAVVFLILLTAPWWIPFLP